MGSVGNGRFGQCAAVVAAVVIAAVGLGTGSPSHAQIPDLGVLNKLKNLKKPPAGKAPVQVPKGVVGVPGAKGPVGVPLRPGFANRPGVGVPNAATLPNGRMPNGLPNNARINPAIPNTKTGIAPGLNAKAGGPPALNAKAGAPLSLNAKGGPAGLNAKAGPAALNSKTGAVAPNAKGIGSTPGARGATLPNTKSANAGPANARFGNIRPGPQARGNVGPGSRGFTNRDPRMRAVNAATPQLRQVQRVTHRTELFAARRLLPTRPLPGERNFTGVPPANETRFVTTEMICQWGPNITPQRIDEIARRHNLTIIATEQSALTGGTLVQFRIGGGRATSEVVRAMEAEQIVSQPNYVYVLNQDQAAPAEQAAGETGAAETAAANSKSGESEQYVANKLRLAEAHKIATGKGVLVAVIDSQVDGAHPELADTVAATFDAVGQTDKPHPHGTGMTSAIVSGARLMGVAPDAKALTVHAFSTGTQQSPQATTRHIVAGLEWAMAQGARVINMSFAGPFDPMLALAMKNASAKGAILIAAVGNAGPKSPPLYPAADLHVIGVTATDENDKLYKGANRGAQVAVASPGVDVIVAAPAEAYQLTTGTSVAAAHVSGVVALMLEKHPDVDAQTVLEVLTASATRLGANKRNEELGWGLIDPLAALAELEGRLADTKVAGNTPAPATAAATPAAARSPAMAPAAAAAKPALPRPGIYVPKQ
jgi:subtilisin family serine protease